MADSKTNAEKSPKFEDLFSSLPQDIKVEILSRLPLKTVAQSRAVCPAWNLSHGNPSLLDMLISRRFALDRTWIFLGIDLIGTSICFIELSDDAGEEENGKAAADRMIREIDLPCCYDFNPCWVFGSINGLLCLTDYTYPKKRVYLCNPFTKTFKILPKNHLNLISKVDFRSDSYHSVFGFGYNPTSGDYTVVSVDYWKKPGEEEKINANVYTLKSNVWRRANNVPVHRLRKSSILAGGRLHWLREDNSGIISFDLADNLFREVPMDLAMIVRKSVHLRCKYHCLHIAVLGGLLSLAVDDSRRIVVWGMREYGVKESWERLYTLGQSFYEKYTLSRADSIHVLGLRKNGDLLLAVKIVGLVSYNPRDGAVVLFSESGGFEMKGRWVRVSDFITPSALCF